MVKDAIKLRNELRTLLEVEPLDYSNIIKLSNDLSKLDPKFQRFSIDAKTLIHLGRDSIKDHTTALIELVKNSYDADALNVDVEVFCRNGKNYIRVADNGFGMNKSQLLNNWLRIGFSDKKKSKLSNLGRRKTGEKGIGRISTDRLGSKLELITKTEEDGIIGLRINWDEFDIEGKDISDINIEITSPESINIPLKKSKTSKSGTEIKIQQLRQPWTPNNIENLYYELSALTPPFNEVKDFEVKLKNDVSQAFSKRVDANFYKAAEIELTAIYDGKGSEIFYSIKDKYNKKETTDSVEWQRLLQRVFRNDVKPDEINDELSLGPIMIKILFFLREAASIKDTKFSLSDLRVYLDNNAGVKIYRDDFAVRPYGYPGAQFGYDWLDLDERKSRSPAGISRAEDYRVNSNQLIGAVFISRDKNPKLTDSAAREGLVESESFLELKALVIGSIMMLESHRAKIYPLIEKTRKRKETKTANEEAEKIKKELHTVKEFLSGLKNNLRKEKETLRFLKPVEEVIEQVESISEEVNFTINEMLNWQRVLSGLATMGISSAVFGHETENSISQFKSSVSTARLVLTDDPPGVITALLELEKALKHSKKVAAWGAYALTRVQREKRNKRVIHIKRTLAHVIKELLPAFEAASIQISIEGETVYSNTFQMDIESILVNLLTNAYTACLLKSGQRKVIVYVEREDKEHQNGFYFQVSDTGHGIAKEFSHMIFEPLFSTKTIGANKSKSVGTGLGLTIVKSIVDDLKGEIRVDGDPVLKGARFKIWLPKED